MTSGEERTWFRIAEKLGMSVSEAKRKITSSEFVRWRIHMDMCLNEDTKLDDYLQQICHMLDLVRLSFGGGTPLDPDKFKLKYEPQKNETPKEKTKETKEEYTARSKSSWFSFLTGSSK